MTGPANPFEVWCSQHECPPTDCFDIHNPMHAEVKRLKRNAVSLCEHDNPVETCVRCQHERLQIEIYGTRGDGPQADSDDGTPDSNASEVPSTREGATQTVGGN